MTLTDREPTREELEEALAYYKRTLALHPEDEIMWMLYGNALCAVDDYPEAVKAYEKATAGRRPLPEVYYLLGVARMSAGDFGGAAAAFEKHLQLFQDVEVLVLTSLCLDVEDDRARSKAFFDAAMRKDGERAMAYLREYAEELVEAEGEATAQDAEIQAGLKAAIGHIDEYLTERTKGGDTRRRLAPRAEGKSRGDEGGFSPGPSA